MRKYFVVAHLTVQESKGKEQLNNPGGVELMKRLGGPAGLPFFAFVNQNGEKLVNSKDPKGANIGHPAEPQEIDWFMEMLKIAAPQMKDEERSVLENALRSQKR